MFKTDITIKEIVLRLAKSMRDKSGYTTLDLVCNAEAFAEALVAELAKENEPVAWCVGYDSPRHSRIHSNPTMYKPEAEALVLATVQNFGLSVCDLYALPPTAEQIEQETAEAIAKHFEQSGIGGEYLAEVIRSGAWKECK